MWTKYIRISNYTWYTNLQAAIKQHGYIILFNEAKEVNIDKSREANARGQSNISMV